LLDRLVLVGVVGFHRHHAVLLEEFLNLHVPGLRSSQQ
jgi:hypothetical protein